MILYEKITNFSCSLTLEARIYFFSRFEKKGKGEIHERCLQILKLIFNALLMKIG